MSSSIRKFLFESCDGIRRRKRRRGRRKEKSLGGNFKTVIRPSITVEKNKRDKRGIEGKDAIDTSRVLERSGEKSEKADVLRDEGSRGLQDGGPASNGGGTKRASLNFERSLKGHLGCEGGVQIFL